MRRLFSALALCALLPASALAGSVYLNGVLIDGVTNQKFEKVVSVRLDEKGDVHIDAPSYGVKTVGAPPPAPAPAPVPLAPAAQPPAPAPIAAPAPVAAPAPAPAAPERITQRYFLVTEQTVPGMTDYDIDVFINSAWVRKLRNGEDQVITEITHHLRPGKNTVLMMAHKLAIDSRRSQSPQHVFKVIIGEGNAGGRNVMIDNQLIRFQRTAAEAEDLSEEFTLTTR